MGVETNIGWTHSTFNLVRGCVEDEGSPACDECYAKAMAKRNPKLLGTWGSVQDGGVRVVAPESYMKEALKWNKQAEAAGERRRVFAYSLGDVFEEWDGPMTDIKGNRLWHTGNAVVPWEGAERSYYAPVTMQDVRNRLFSITQQTPWLDWLLLTKRPQNISRMWPSIGASDYGRWIPNVWLGCTVENQEQADRRIPELLKCRDLSPVLWLSCEPLLGPLELSYPESVYPDGPEYCCNGSDCGCLGKPIDPPAWLGKFSRGIDWVITGAESGPHARPTDIKWFRHLAYQCAYSHVPFFMKQAVVDGELVKELSQFPEDLRIQEFPKVAR